MMIFYLCNLYLNNLIVQTGNMQTFIKSDAHKFFFSICNNI